jgi:hypothetical protein
MVPIGQRAGRAVGREVRLEPALLLRVFFAAYFVAVAVEDDYVPGVYVVAVVALPGSPAAGLK